MKLLVLGGSGGCGRWLVRLAADQGHHVTAVIRPQTSFEAPPGVGVLRGEVLDADFLRGAVEGVEVVLCALGLRRAGKSPWSALLSPADLMERVAGILVSSMRSGGVSRGVVISAAGVGDSIAQLSRPVRWLVRQGQLRVAYRDLERMEQVLACSGLDILTVRPVTLLDGPPRKQAQEVERYGLTSTVRRSEVADWMLSAAERPDRFSKRAVLLGT